MKPSSAKQKGRFLQQFTRDILLEYSQGLEPDDILSASMGANGEDILLSPAARKQYPMSIECKNVEKLNIWEAIKQAKANSRKYVPAVVFTKNNEEAYIAIPIDYFMEVSFAKAEPSFFLNFGSWLGDRVSSWSNYIKTGKPKCRAKIKHKDQDDY